MNVHVLRERGELRSEESTVPAPQWYLAVDIGGTAIKYALLDPDQQLVGISQIPTPVMGGAALVDAVAGLVSHAAGAHALGGVGISTAGTLDRNSGRVVFSTPTIPDYAGTAWRDRLHGVLSAPVVVQNDAVAALKGELWKGSLRDVGDDVYYVTLGTGIGGARCRGAGAPGRRHVEATAVGYLLRDAATDSYWESRASVAVLARTVGDRFGPDADVERLFGRAKRGDGDSLDCLADWAAVVAEGLTEIVLVSEPRYIVIGGGVSAQGDFLRSLLVPALKKWLPPRPLRTELRVAELGNRAALYGAVCPFLVGDSVC